MDGDEQDDADSDDSPNVQIRLVPTDTSCRMCFRIQITF